MNDLIADLRRGNARALARAITLVENRSRGSEELVRAVFGETGKSRVVGVTGSPGAGKSTIVDRLAREYSATSHAVGVVAVDPSSPFTGGAVLGDRVRMPDLEGLDGVFVRSMATRGSLGGLAAATADVVTLMDASRRDPIFVETVGVGQDEVDIVGVADLSVVVLVPGMGDDIQALKAGIMEIGDIFVINKSDRPGADAIERTIAAMLALAPDRGTPVPILRTVATEGTGIEGLVAAIDHASVDPRQEAMRLDRRRRAAGTRLRSLLEEKLVDGAFRSILSKDEFAASIDAVAHRQTDPYTVVNAVLEQVRFGEPR